MLVAMLNKPPKEGERVFHHYTSLENLRRCFERYRKRASHKLGNPRMLQINFHTLRHWKAAMEYYKTKDVLHVMQVLGHKRIQNTLIYTQLIKNAREDEYVCKVSRTPSEIQELIENGFKFVCQKDDLVFFVNANSCRWSGKNHIMVPRAGLEPATDGDFSRKLPFFSGYLLSLKDK
jgi:hypothetical protein